MPAIKISFLALSSGYISLEQKSNQEIKQIFNDLFFVFTSNINHKNYIITYNDLQQNTVEFRKKFSSFVQKYETVDPKIQQLNSYFQNLEDNEYFIFVLNSTLSIEYFIHYFQHLQALKDNVSPEIIERKIANNLEEIRKYYDISTFNALTKNRIGEYDKTKRICRFCNKSTPDVTFRKVAHTISEALGNKKIITNDECDSCNEKFGTGIEDDFIVYLDLIRITNAIKGKNGIPKKIKGKNLEIETTGKQITIKQMRPVEIVNCPDFNDLNLRFEPNKKIKTQNIYRALVKYALGVIDKEYLVHFSETIEWVNGSKDFEKLPKIAVLTSSQSFLKHPQIIVALRKTDEKNLPYAIAEFGFTCWRFVYILPATNEDRYSFTTEEEYQKFWQFFKQYSSTPNWTFKTMNGVVAETIPVDIIVDINK